MIKGWKNKYVLIVFCLTAFITDVAGQQNIQFTQYILTACVSIRPMPVIRRNGSCRPHTGYNGPGWKERRLPASFLLTG